MLGVLLDAARRVAGIGNEAALACEGLHGSNYCDQPIGLERPVLQVQMQFG